MAPLLPAGTIHPALGVARMLESRPSVAWRVGAGRRAHSPLSASPLQGLHPPQPLGLWPFSFRLIPGPGFLTGPQVWGLEFSAAGASWWSRSFWSHEVGPCPAPWSLLGPTPGHWILTLENQDDSLSHSCAPASGPSPTLCSGAEWFLGQSFGGAEIHANRHCWSPE